VGSRRGDGWPTLRWCSPAWLVLVAILAAVVLFFAVPIVLAEAPVSPRPAADPDAELTTAANPALLRLGLLSQEPRQPAILQDPAAGLALRAVEDGVLVEVDALDRSGADVAGLVELVVDAVDLRVLRAALA
jgi:hypothetical protein